MTLISLLPVLAICLIAQWSDRDRLVRWVTYALLVSLDGVVLLIGLSALVLSQRGQLAANLVAHVPGLVSSRWAGLGGFTVGGAVISLVVLLPSVRRRLAQLIPIDSKSAIHATALSMAALLTGLNLAQVELIGGLGSLAQSAGTVGFTELLTSNLPIGLFAFIGVGFLVRRNGRQTIDRLGLKPVTWKQFGLVLVLTLVIVVVFYGIDKLWKGVDLQSYKTMESISNVLFGGADKFWQAVLLSLSAAITEELLFRGALQPRFGYLPTAVLFALAHVQYGWTFAGLEVFIAGLVLGWLRSRANTSACLLLHLLYDVLAMTLFPLLP